MSPLISFFYSFFNTNCIHLDCPIVHTLISFILCLGTGMCSVSSLLHLRSSLCHMCHIIPRLDQLLFPSLLMCPPCPVFCVMCTFSYLISHSSFQLINLMYLSTLELKNLSTQYGSYHSILSEVGLDCGSWQLSIQSIVPIGNILSSSWLSGIDIFLLDSIHGSTSLITIHTLPIA